MLQKLGIDSETINSISNLVGGVVSIIISIVKLCATGFLYAIGKVLTDGLASVDGSTSGGIITPFKIFFNKYKLLDINFFDMNAGGIVTPKLRMGVAKWFYIVRNIAASILLIVLIYIGIRMAITTIASDKAKYKKMLIDWTVSLVLIFVLQYMAIFIIYLNNAIVTMIEGLSGTYTDLDDAISTILSESLFGIGINGIMAFLVYVMITIQTIFFLIAYINRLLKLAFLIIISPLISITYSIDKIGDGKAQALNTWIKEFLYTILIQPFDCIMYIAFVTAAANLIVPASLDKWGLNPQINLLANAVLAILCLKFINDGEKMIKKIFHFEDTDTGTSMAAGAALAVMAVQRTQKLASSGKKMFGKDSAIGKAATKDLEFLKGSKIGQGFDKVKGAIGGSKVGQGFDKIKDSISASKIGQGFNLAQRTISGFNKQKNAFFQSKNGMRLSRLASKTSSLALGGMAAAMMYAGGDTGALEAFAMGKKVSRMSGEKFAKSLNTVAGGVTKSNEDLEQADEKNLDKEIASVTEDLAESGLSEEEMDDVDTLENKANEEDQNVEDTKKAVAMEKRQERIKELEDAMANINAMRVARPDKLNEKRFEEYRQMEEEKARLEREPLSEAELAATNNDSRVIEAQKNAAKARGISEVAKQRQKLLTDKQNFYTEEAIKSRVEKRGRTISDTELNAKKDEIIALILQISAQRKLNQMSETDVDTSNVIDDEDFKTAEGLTEKLISTIQHCVLTGSDFDVRDYVDQHIGVSVEDNPKSLGYQLASIVDEYKYLADRNNVAQNGFGAAESFGVKRDKFAERLAEGSYTRKSKNSRGATG